MFIWESALFALGNEKDKNSNFTMVKMLQSEGYRDLVL